MTGAPLPIEARLGPDESLLGDWVFRIEVRDVQIAEVEYKFLLTSERLIALSHPIPRESSDFAWQASHAADKDELTRKTGTWNVELSIRLAQLPEPKLGEVGDPTHPNAPPRRAVVIGEKYCWVGNDPRAEELLNRIRSARASAQVARRGP